MPHIVAKALVSDFSHFIRSQWREPALRSHQTLAQLMVAAQRGHWQTSCLTNRSHAVCRAACEDALHVHGSPGSREAFKPGPLLHGSHHAWVPAFRAHQATTQLGPVWTKVPGRFDNQTWPECIIGALLWATAQLLVPTAAGSFAVWATAGLCICSTAGRVSVWAAPA